MLLQIDYKIITPSAVEIVCLFVFSILPMRGFKGNRVSIIFANSLEMSS